MTNPTTTPDKCTHTKTISGHYVKSFIDEDGEQHYNWEDEWEQPSTIDVDLHHYRCTQCGKVMRY